jgi:phage FluMu gp28-like protein
MSAVGFLPAPVTENKRGKARIVPADRSNLFLPYQQRWIEDDSRIKICEKPRQVGWSWATAYRTVAEGSAKGQRYDHWISSRDDAQARLFLQDCSAFAEVLQLAASDMGEQVIDEKGHTAQILRLANGRRINSMSSNPNAQAGKRGSRVLDEFALHPDPKMLYDIAFPGITWGGSLEIFSTHRGSGNFFNQLIRDVKERGNKRRMSLHTVTLQTALDQGFLWKLQTKLPDGDERLDMDEAEYFDDVRARCSDEEAFMQEYMCVPADDATAFLEYGLIDACVYGPNVQWESSIEDLVARRADLYIGIDVGRKKDLTVVWVLERVSGHFFTRALMTFDRVPFSLQEAQIWPWVQIARRTCVDSTGLGLQFAERMQQRFGTYAVEAVHFTAQVKEELAYPVRSNFEDRRLTIPNDPVVIADLRKIRKETTTAGNVRFTAERDDAGHADRFWAVALALHAGKQTAGAGSVSISERNFSNRGFLGRRTRRVSALVA